MDIISFDTIFLILGSPVLYFEYRKNIGKTKHISDEEE
jgi:hypothetical protein